jgi:hypothetical protein
MKHKRLTAVAVAVTAGSVGAGSALGTPGVGILGAPILARGTLEAQHGHHAHHKGKRHRPVRIELRKPSDVIVQQVTLAPGGSTGWHSHPGPALVIVKSGSFTLYDGDDRRCKGTRYAADPQTPAVGKAFIDEGRGHVHIGRNEGSTNTELYVTYLDVPLGAEPRIDAPRPGNCPF